MDAHAPSSRIEVRVRGAVQGVGFRPHVWRLARKHGLSGFVLNDRDGVRIEVEGADVAGFLNRLSAEAPPLARIDAIETRVLTLHTTTGEGFVIAPSGPSGAGRGRIPPDAGVCRACLEEMSDPDDRRWRHAFIACTDCGPRFTMTARLPYDRPQTAMARFPLCPACAGEYHDPATRRYHAEPTCCPACGPRLDEPVDAIWSRLSAGQVIALKGIGGYHLVCDAANAAAVSRLRMFKGREAKPFAVMTLNLASARLYAEIGGVEAETLCAPMRPILILPRRHDAPIADGVCGGLPTLGLMLAYSPLHALLFHEAAGRPTGSAWLDAPLARALVATSGNLGGEALITDDREAKARLGPLVDAVIAHDRDILVRCDDPVARVTAGQTRLLRRGRGATPEPIVLPTEIEPTLGFGGHLKAAVCVTRGREAFLAQHAGDLDDPDTIQFYRETINHLCAVLDVRPARVACDLHPDFVSTRFAEETGLPLVRVQHHHAHAEACAAEVGLAGPYLALTLDGYGYGADGGAWGGEALLVTAGRARRVGAFAPIALPGGDRAAREPWRMAVAALAALGRLDEVTQRFGAHPQAAAIAAMAAAGRFGKTSSCGRWFDAAAGLLGLCVRQSFEGEAAQRLEGLCDAPALGLGLFRLSGDGVLDFRPALDRLLDVSPREGAAIFHGAVIEGLCAQARLLAGRHGLSTVALGGGCFANRVLAEGVLAGLSESGLTARLGARAPCGDGGLALGQVWAGRTNDGEGEGHVFGDAG